MATNTTKTGKVTVKEVADRLGTSPVMVRYLIDTGQMPGLVKHNQQRTTYLIPREIFEDWISHRK